MVRTYGLTHIDLAVKDAQRSVRFYGEVFGAMEVWRGPSSIQVTTPGRHDVIAFEEAKTKPGMMGGVTHFGFRLVDPKDIDEAARPIEKAGGKILGAGRVRPGRAVCVRDGPGRIHD